MAGNRKNSAFIGRWRICGMEQWDAGYIDMEEEGFIEFRKGREGEFHFGCVQA
jgi:hypothetical protein